MKCYLKNRCATPNRCCHFCKQKNCWQRCNDNHKGCQWFVNEKDEDGENKEKRDETNTL